MNPTNSLLHVHANSHHHAPVALEHILGSSQPVAGLDMTNPRREPGAARQWGLINNILKSSPQTTSSGQPMRRPRRTQESRERAQIDSASGVQPQPSRPSQHSSRSQHSTFRQQDRHRSRSPRRSSASRLDRRSNHSRHSEEHSRSDRRRSSSAQEKQQHDQKNAQRFSKDAQEELKKPATTTKGIERVEEVSSGKRKRPKADESNNPERGCTTKKQRPNLSREEARNPSSHANVERRSDRPKLTATETTPDPKGQHRFECATVPQLPTPPSSNGSLEYGCSSEQILKEKCISTSTPPEKGRSDFTASRDLPAPRAVGAKASGSRKGQCGSEEDSREGTKRVRQLEASELSNSRQQPLIEPRATPKQIRPTLKAQARAVRPESSFAPVTLNHTCELEFFDYLHDSIPILYSSMITHRSNPDVLNNPSGTLVVNALAIIGPSIDPQAKRGWPSVIDIPGRTASATNPARVVSDVDLYLRKEENELCVTTDRGLITVTTYLDLIGAPRTQSVRFEGTVPSWARAMFRNPEKRRIVWQEKSNAGKTEIVPSNATLGPHQLTLTLETHAEVVEERALTKAWEQQSRPKEEAKPVHPLLPKISASNEKQKAQPKPGEMKILTAEQGHLPLRAGSVVPIGNQDEWAYGRLSGTNIMGRLQMAFTCPLDWSLDRFAATNDALNQPLRESNDPEWKDWRGFYHWVQQEGFAAGPTREQTAAAGIAKARADKARMLATRESRARPETPSTPDVRKAQPERASPQISANNKQSPRPNITARTATAPSAEIVVSTTIKDEVDEATPVLLSPNANGHVGSDLVEDGAVNALIDGLSKGKVETNALFVQDDGEHVEAPAGFSQVQQQEQDISSVGAADQELREAEHKEDMIEVDTDSPDASTERGRGDISTEPGALTENEATDARSADVHREARVETPEEESRAAKNTPVHENPFSEPRLDLWTRNDDIEYDWGDSDEEL